MTADEVNLLTLINDQNVASPKYIRNLKPNRWPEKDKLCQQSCCYHHDDNTDSKRNLSKAVKVGGRDSNQILGGQGLTIQIG